MEARAQQIRVCTSANIPQNLAVHFPRGYLNHRPSRDFIGSFPDRQRHPGRGGRRTTWKWTVGSRL